MEILTVIVVGVSCYLLGYLTSTVISTVFKGV